MKVLWHSNGPWCPTGYGNQTQLFVPRLAAAGHDVAISAFYGLNGAMLMWNGIRVYPGGYHPYGNDVLPAHAMSHFGGKLEDGVIVTLVDAWVLDPVSLASANVLCWTPVDHDPAPRHVLDFLAASQARPVAMSRHGEGALTAAGFPPAYVPHGVDTLMYYPEPMLEARRSLGLPEQAFIVGMVAANKGYPSRKGFGQAIEAFAAFRDGHPDALLFLHTEMNGHVQGVNIGQILAAYGVPEDAVLVADPYRYLLSYPPEHMRALYSSFDVLINPAYGEGFGIPVLEAQACGTPVIVTDWTAMPEVGAVGWQVPGQRFFTNQGSFQMIPDAWGLQGALVSAYETAGQLRGAARAHALRYDADAVTRDYWLPVLEQAGEREVVFRDTATVAFPVPLADVSVRA